MANSLLIEKETGGYFGFTLTIDSVVQDKVRNMRNDAFAIDNIVHFKTATGANIVKQQNISVFDITLIASGTFTFTDIDTLLEKLVDVGYWEWMLGSGSGGVDRFDEMLDTFDYFGNDMKGVRVNESQMKLEPFTVYNYRKSTDLEDMPSVLIPNKMFVVNEDATGVILKDQPSEPITYLNAVGSFHYSDLATTTVPLVVLPATPKKLENDTLGAYTIVSNAPFGVSSVWNPVNNQFNFSQLSIGDILTLRVDANVTTTTANQTLKCYVKMGVGSASEFDLILAQAQVKTAGSYPFVAEVSFDLAYQDIVDSPAELYVLSDDDASLIINGWYIDILRKNINIVEIESASDPLKEDVANKVSAISGSSETEYPNEKAVVDYVDSKLPSDYATVVYVDTNDPNTATIFDDVNPPLVNDPLLEDDVDNLYIGADSSTWVYNGVTYTTEIVPESSNFTINGTEVDAGNNKTSPISRLFPITVQEKFNDTADNSGVSMNPRHIGMWNWLSAVTKYAKIKWDNIGVNVTFQMPTTADNSTETFAMVSDLTDKQDVLTETNFGTFENSLTAKATPIDADLITIVDTADSNKAKKTTFTQLKVFFKTYWDTLYQVILISGTNIKTINGSSILGSGDLTVGGAPTEAQIATINHAATAKTVLVDADEVNGTNSATSFSLIRTVWSDVWIYIKSKADTYYQPKGVRITNATTTGSYAVDWNAGDVWQLTLTGATTITDTNLPTGTATKVIELMVKGAFAITLPAYWEATPSSGTYTGAKWNHIVVSCIVGTISSEKVIYSNEVLAT